MKAKNVYESRLIKIKRKNVPDEIEGRIIFSNTPENEWAISRIASIIKFKVNDAQHTLKTISLYDIEIIYYL